MNVVKNYDADKLTVKLEGRLDTTTAPELEAAIKEDLEKCNELVFDFVDLEYISSAGLRVLLSTQKVMMKKSGMVITNARDEIKEVFDITGFADILNIQ